MTSRPFDLLASTSGYVATAVIIFSAAKLCRSSKLDAIPTVGSSSWLGSWWAGITFLNNALDVIREGYKKHKSAPFKIAEFGHWIVIVSSRKHMEELQRAPDDELSLTEARLQVKYTMGQRIHHDPYHATLFGSRLTRNIGALFPEIRDEIVASFDDVLDLRGNEWKSVPALSSIENVVCRISNRVFVGLPLCRDPDWIDINLQYALGVAKRGFFIALFPDLLKPIAARFLSNFNQSNRRARKLLGPVIKERQKSLNEHGNEWINQPNDFLSWLMDEAEGPELTEESLTARILSVNFSAVPTSSITFTHALFYLAANPQYIQPLRDEVEAVVENEGWSKVAVGKMYKIDSFLRECQRLEGMVGLTLMRKALKDFTFSDGMCVPKGTTVFAATQCIHYDDAIYENAHSFQPFRFSDLHEGDDDVGHQLVTTTTEYLAFGHGRHACSGRFFAANELKTMLAHIVVTYDIKLADNSTLPQAVRLGYSLLPDPSAKVMFRRVG